MNSNARALINLTQSEHRNSREFNLEVKWRIRLNNDVCRGSFELSQKGIEAARKKRLKVYRN